MIAIMRRAFGGKLLKRCLMGLNGQLKTLCPGLPLAQDAKGVAKVVLRHGPMERYALAGAHLKRRTIGLHGLFEARRAAFPLAQGLKGVAEVVCVPAQWSGTCSRVCSSSAAR